MIDDAKKWLMDFREEMLERLDESRYRETLRFLAKMLLAGLVFRAVLFLDPSTEIFQIWLAEISRTVLNLFNYGFERHGFLLVGEGTNYLITRDCLGWKSMAAFVALVFSSTDEMRREIKTILLGLLGLAIANTVRIVTTVILSEAGVISFEVVHTFLWRWSMTFIVLGIWYLWLDNGLKPEIRGIFK